jgi:hypothetical protein
MFEMRFRRIELRLLSKALRVDGSSGIHATGPPLLAALVRNGIQQRAEPKGFADSPKLTELSASRIGPPGCKTLGLRGGLFLDAMRVGWVRKFSDAL